MNAPHPLMPAAAAAADVHDSRDAPRLREIPYNYTSFSDREIVKRPRLSGPQLRGSAPGPPSMQTPGPR